MVSNKLPFSGIRLCINLYWKWDLFTYIYSDPEIYVHFHGQDIIILVIYIDNSLFIGSNKSYLKFKKKNFMDCWKSRNFGEATEYLGMWIT